MTKVTSSTFDPFAPPPPSDLPAAGAPSTPAGTRPARRYQTARPSPAGDGPPHPAASAPAGAGTRPAVPTVRIPSAPGRRAVTVDPVLHDLTGLALADLDDDTVARIVAAGQAEQRRRSLMAGNAQALLEEAFSRMFDRQGLPLLPELAEGKLICPGGLVGRSVTSHRCRFVSVDRTWVWDHDDALADEVRTESESRKRTVTVLPAVEGLELDVVSCKMSMGTHKMTGVTSMVVRAGKLQQVAGRGGTVRTDGDR